MTVPPGRPGLELGRVVITRAALDMAVERGIDVRALLDRHRTGDWGDLDKHDTRANRAAVEDGERVLSSYGAEDDPGRLWIITEADRSVTTVLRPHDY